MCTKFLIIIGIMLFVFRIPGDGQVSEPTLYGLYVPLNELSDYAEDLQKVGIYWLRVGGINDKGCLLAAEKGLHLVPVLSLRSVSLNNTVQIDQVDQVISEWRAQVHRTVERYGANGSLWKEHPESRALPIRYWEIWNEPNIEFLNPPQGMTRVQLYARILKAASEEIRKLDPSASIIAFNTSGGASEGKPSPDVYVEQWQYFGWRRFIRETIQLTGVECFDAIGLHPYTQPMGPESGGTIKGLDLLRELAIEQKFSDKQIWFTEVGYPIEYPRNKQVRDERQQACFTVRLYAIAAAHGVTQIQNMYLEDIIYRQDSTRRSFGFFTAPGKWREQATALHTMIQLIPDPRINPKILDENKNGVYAYQFSGFKDSHIIMAWNTGEELANYEFKVNTGVVTVVNMFGTIFNQLKVRNGKIQVSLSEAPVYIIPETKANVERLINKLN